MFVYLSSRLLFWLVANIWNINANPIPPLAHDKSRAVMMWRNRHGPSNNKPVVIMMHYSIIQRRCEWHQLGAPRSRPKKMVRKIRSVSIVLTRQTWIVGRLSIEAALDVFTLSIGTQIQTNGVTRATVYYSRPGTTVRFCSDVHNVKSNQMKSI